MIKPNNSKENKVLNRNNVIKMLMLHAPLSRIELSKFSGLSKMTLTNIINEFLEEGIVTEGEKGITATSGRKPITLSLSENGFAAIGVYISRSSVSGCVLSAVGKIHAIESVPLGLSDNQETFEKKLRFVAGSLMRQAEGHNLWGIGVGAIGPVDIRSGTILNPPDFYGITEIPVKEILSTEYGMPVYIDNDMNAAAVAEKYFGLAKRMNDFIYIGVTNGIGAGIFSGGKLLAGSSGLAGELGHTAVDINGLPCPCGSRGCLELYADIKHTVARFRESAAAGAKTMVVSPDTADYRDLCTALESGDPLCASILNEQCRYLAAGITGIVNLFDPECIILGHELAHAGKFASEAIAQEVNSRTLFHDFKHVPVVVSSFYENTPLIGSAAQVFDRVLSGR